MVFGAGDWRRDSGRDAYGTYSIGPSGDRVHLDFSLEAKCYKPGHGCGVKDTSRLISRLRHRQFGILITTSYVDLQAYREIKEDQHPIIVISAGDIVGLLRRHGHADATAVRVWLDREFSAATIAPSATIEPGPLPRAFGSYQLVEEIGRGAMGVVYKAWDRELKRFVAPALIDWLGIRNGLTSSSAGCCT